MYSQHSALSLRTCPTMSGVRKHEHRLRNLLHNARCVTSPAKDVGDSNAPRWQLLVCSLEAALNASPTTIVVNISTAHHPHTNIPATGYAARLADRVRSSTHHETLGSLGGNLVNSAPSNEAGAPGSTKHSSAVRHAARHPEAPLSWLGTPLDTQHSPTACARAHPNLSRQWLGSLCALLGGPLRWG